MCQKHLVLSLGEEGPAAKQIYERLVETFGPLVIAYSTVTKTLKKTYWAHSDERIQNFGG
jgi:hypothetical protein